MLRWHPPERSVLSCLPGFWQLRAKCGQVVGKTLVPGGAWPPGGLFHLSGSCINRIWLASANALIRARCPNRESQRDLTTEESGGCWVIPHTASFLTKSCHYRYATSGVKAPKESQNTDHGPRKVTHWPYPFFIHQGTAEERGFTLAVQCNCYHMHFDTFWHVSCFLVPHGVILSSVTVACGNYSTKMYDAILLYSVECYVKSLTLKNQQIFCFMCCIYIDFSHFLGLSSIEVICLIN